MKPRFYRNQDPAQPAVNFDALIEPDNGPTTEIPANLPDMTLQIKAQLESQQQHQQQVPNEPSAQPDPYEWMKPYNPLNEKIKAKFEDFELPADVTPETYHDQVLGFLESKIQKPQIDPVLEQFQSHLALGKSIDEVVNDYAAKNSFLKMKPEDRMFHYMKNELGHSDENPTGLSDDEIIERVDKMKQSGTLELQDKNIVREYQLKQKEHEEQKQADNYKKYIDSFTEEENHREQIISNSLQDFNKLDNIAGIPLDPKEKTEFESTIRYITKRDPNTGLSIADAMLQSNQMFLKAMYLLLRAEPKIRQTITEAKEGVKQNILNKLSQEPVIGKGFQNQENPLQVDLDALAAPEQ